MLVQGQQVGGTFGCALAGVVAGDEDLGQQAGMAGWRVSAGVGPG